MNVVTLTAVIFGILLSTVVVRESQASTDSTNSPLSSDEPKTAATTTTESPQESAEPTETTATTVTTEIPPTLTKNTTTKATTSPTTTLMPTTPPVQADLGKNCTMPEGNFENTTQNACLVDNAFCKKNGNDGLCACSKGFYQSNTSKCSKVCGTPNNISNGEIHVIEITEPAIQEANVSCQNGYEPSTSVIVCEESGIWQYVQCNVRNATYGEVCVPYSESCIQENTTCKEEMGDFLCRCTNDHFYLNETCVEKITLEADKVNCQLEYSQIFKEIRIRCSTNYTNDYFDSYHIDVHPEGKTSFAISSNRNRPYTEIKFAVLSGRRYKINISMSRHGVPSKLMIPLLTGTVPLKVHSWAATDANKTSIRFKQNDTDDQAFDNYCLVVSYKDAWFDIECKPCDDNFVKSCSLNRNVSEFTLYSLSPGHEYSVKVYTELRVTAETILRSEESHNFSTYTVPDLPKNLRIPSENISDSSFVVLFDDDPEINFITWRTDVFANESLEKITSELTSRSNTSMVISNQIKPATYYLAIVTSHVPNRLSEGKEMNVTTRPSSLKKSSFKETVTETEIIITINDEHELTYDYLQVVVHSNSSFYWHFGDNDTICPLGSQCLLSRTLFVDRQLNMTLKGLVSGTFYEIYVFTVFSNMTSDGSVNLSTFTVPELPETVRVLNITSNTCVVMFEETKKQFSSWTINIQDSDNETTTDFQSSTHNSFHKDELKSGTKYTLEVYTTAGNHTSRQTFEEMFTTLPSTPSSLEVPRGKIGETSFVLEIHTSDLRYDHINVYVCEVKELSVCVNKTINNTQHEDNIVEVKVEDLQAAVNYSISARTVLKSGEESDVLTTYTVTGPVLPFASLERAEMDSITLNVSGNDGFQFDTYCIKQENGNFSHLANRSKDLISISGLYPGHTYTFHIYTIFDGIESENYTIVMSYTKPNAVIEESIEIFEKTNSSLTITWSNITGGHVDGFRLEWHCESPNIGSKMDSFRNKTVLNLKSSTANLDPGTFCNVSITSFINNYDNNSLSGKTVLKQLVQSTNEEAPGILSVNSSLLNSTSTTLTWSLPDKRNGIIRRFDIWITLTQETGTCVQRNTLVCGDCQSDTPLIGHEVPSICDGQHHNNFTYMQNNFEWNVKDLHPFRNYSITILAYTVVNGQATATSIFTLEDVPGKPVDLTAISTHNVIELHWNPPVEQNGIVTNYEIYTQYYERLCRSIGDWKNTITHVDMDPLTNYTFNNMYAYWEYNYTVKATNKFDTGQPSNMITVHTKATKSSEVRNVSILSPTPFSVNLTWLEPCYSNGILERYEIHIKNSDTHEPQQDQQFNVTANSKDEIYKKSVDGLLPYRNYTVDISSENSAGSSHLITKTFRTDISAPEEPKHIRLKSNTSSSITVQWESFETFTGPTKILVTAVDIKNVKFNKTVETAVAYWTSEIPSEVTIGDLDAYWKYNVTVTSETFNEVNSFPKVSTTQTFETGEGKPGNLQRLEVTAEKDLTKPRTINVTWASPTERDRNGILVNYTINVDGKQDGVNPDVTMKTFFLERTGNVSVQVRAATSVGLGPVSEDFVFVEPGAPLIHEGTSPLMQLLLDPSSFVENDKVEIAVQLPLQRFLCNNSNGILQSWMVIVAESSNAVHDKPFVGSLGEYNKKKHNTYKRWSDVKDMDSIPPYIATPDTWRPDCTRLRRRSDNNQHPDVFIVGADTDCSTVACYNGELQPGRKYRVKTAACTSTGCTETEYSEPIATAPDLTAPIIGGVVSAVVVIGIVIIVVFILRRRQAACFAKDTESITHTPSEQFNEMQEVNKNAVVYKPGPVQLTMFPDFVEKMHKDSDLLFADAYKSIKEKSPKHPCTVAESQTCRAKNRYTNILSFDHSRVKLRPSDDIDGSDFINANYIPGYTSPREYIATQGPMNATFDDFWRMVWEQNVDTIVMLTKLVEKGRIKCDKYWPDVNEPVYYGDLVVSVTSESSLSDYTLRIFEIKLKEELRSVRQFAYLKWPDMGCPEDPEMLLEFVKSVKEHNKRPGGAKNTGPMIVHCSAGVGRTGTFIVVDHILQHIRDHDEVDVYKLVLDMRNHRCNMVQTEDQFIYIHECLKAFITSDEDDEEDDPVDEHLYENTRFGEDNIYENTAYQNDPL